MIIYLCLSVYYNVYFTINIHNKWSFFEYLVGYSKLLNKIFSFITII